MRLFRFVLPVLLLVGCPAEDDDDDNTTPTDTGVRDSGRVDTGVDAGAPDMGTPDTGAPDTGTPDTGTPDTGVIDYTITGLSDDVEVDFDDNGILHIACTEDLDCVRAQGYFHAAHRFGQMDLRRRFGRGRVSGILPIGPGIDIDRNANTIFRTRGGDAMAENFLTGSSTQTLAMLDAYTDGVNAWIADLRSGRNNARLTDDWAHLADDLADWEREDSIACILSLVEDLTNDGNRELALAEIYGAVTPTMAFDLFSLRPGSPATILPANQTITAEDRQRIHQLGEVQGRLQMALPAIRGARAKLPPKNADRGSNNWVIGPTRSASGAPLLANDPHLGMEFPSIWYLAHLDAKTNGNGQLHVAGASFAGIPGIILGQNEDIAWGATVAFFDHTDVYIETLNQAGDAVIFNGQEVPILERTYQIRPLDTQAIPHTVRFVPHHGPIIFEDPNMGIAISLRWTAMDSTTDANFIWEMNTASNVIEARTALEQISTIGQNWVVIDNGGDFGWFPYNAIPDRPWASQALPPYLPLPGDGSAEWGPPLPYASLPQAYNPPEGYIATANGDMTGHLADGDPNNDGQAAYQRFIATGYRQERIQERIAGGMSMHDLSLQQSIQGDVHSLLGERTVPALLASVDPGTLTAGGAEVHAALTAWNFECPTGLTGTDPGSAPSPDAAIAAASIGCASFHVLWTMLREAAFRDELDAIGVNANPFPSALIFQVANPGLLLDSYWDDVSTGTVETMGDIVGRTMEQAATWMQGEMGQNRDDWRWGKIHTVSLSPAIFPPSSPDYANDGGLFTVDVANPRGGAGLDFSHGSGPSMRFACEAPPSGVSCRISLPGGQRHFADSPHFLDLMQGWLINDSVPIHFTPQAVQGASVESITITPAP